MTESTTRWIDRNLGRLTILCAVGTILSLVLYGYLQSQFRNQAAQGARARETQMQRQPIFEKLLNWAADDPTSRITRDDLACFRTGEKCPPSRPTP